MAHIDTDYYDELEESHQRLIRNEKELKIRNLDHDITIMEVMENYDKRGDHDKQLNKRVGFDSSSIFVGKVLNDLGSEELIDVESKIGNNILNKSFKDGLQTGNWMTNYDNKIISICLYDGDFPVFNMIYNNETMFPIAILEKKKDHNHIRIWDLNGSLRIRHKERSHVHNKLCYSKMVRRWHVNGNIASEELDLRSKLSTVDFREPHVKRKWHENGLIKCEEWIFHTVINSLNLSTNVYNNTTTLYLHLAPIEENLVLEYDVSES
jgi:hypothetical protein